MAFALVHFYKEDTWDIIPYSDIVLEDENMGKDELKGFKTLVMWKGGKGKKSYIKVPATIIEISDSKDYLLKRMKGEDTSPIKTGKGCRKRLTNAKYMIESEDEEDDMEPVISKKLKVSGPKKTEARRSADLASLIKERLTKQRQPDIKDQPFCTDECEHKKQIILLEEKVRTLESENKRLSDLIENGNDLKTSLRKLRRYVSALEESQSATPQLGPISSPVPMIARKPMIPSTNCASDVPGSGRSTPLSSGRCTPLSSGRSTPDNISGRSTPDNISGRSTPDNIPGRSSPLSGSTVQKCNPFPTVTTAVCQSRRSELPEETTTQSPGDCLEIPDTDLSSDMVNLGPNLVLKKSVFKRIVPKKVGTYVASIMGATLSREHMATHSYKGQKGKNGQTKPRLDAVYTSSLIEHAKGVKYSNMPRDVIDEDVVKAIKFKLNNEEQAWKKQTE